MAASSLQPLQAGSSFLFFLCPIYNLGPCIRLFTLPGRPHPEQLAVVQGERALQGAVTEVRCVVCAGQSELMAIVGGVLAAALLIAAVIVALVCYKKSKRKKYTSKR